MRRLRWIGLAGAVALLATGCLARYPYLSDATGTTTTVNFATTQASPVPAVTYGTPAAGCTGSSVNAAGPVPVAVGGSTRYQWDATMTGLSPNTEYCYRIAQGSEDLLGPNASPKFVTPPGPTDDTPFSFAVIGDWGAGTIGEQNVLAQLGAGDSDFIMTAGDNVYLFGHQEEYGDFFNNGRAFGEKNLGKRAAGRPMFPVLGNHGFEDFTPQLVNFPQDAVVSASGGRYQGDTYCCITSDPTSATYASAWYAFDWGPARFYVLEAAWKDLDVTNQYQADFEAHWNGPVDGCPVCGTQKDWLAADLAAHEDTELKFAFFHFPLYSDSLHGGDEFLTGPGSLEELLAANGVDVVFNGHDHTYQRNLPTVSGSDMVSYVTGGGGQFPYPILRCPATTAYAVGGGGTSCNGPARTPNEHVFHYLHVAVDGTEVTVTPTDSTGEIFDVQTYNFGP